MLHPHRTAPHVTAPRPRWSSPLNCFATLGTSCSKGSTRAPSCVATAWPSLKPWLTLWSSPSKAARRTSPRPFAPAWLGKRATPSRIGLLIWPWKPRCASSEPWTASLRWTQRGSQRSWPLAVPPPTQRSSKGSCFRSGVRTQTWSNSWKTAPSRCSMADLSDGRCVET